MKGSRHWLTSLRSTKDTTIKANGRGRNARRRARKLISLARIRKGEQSLRTRPFFSLFLFVDATLRWEMEEAREIFARPLLSKFTLVSGKILLVRARREVVCFYASVFRETVYAFEIN